MTTITIGKDLLVDWPLRMVNLLIDVFAIYAFAFILLIIATLIALVWSDAMSVWLTGMTDTGYNILGAVIMSAYYIITELTMQRTLGKYITGTMVVMEDGSKPQARAIVIRTLCRFLPFEVFSFFRSYPRGWHDNSSGTYVVKAKKYKEAIQLQNAFSEIGAQ